MNVPGLNETALPRIIQGVRDLATGASNGIGRDAVVLAEGQTSTTFADPLCGETSIVLLCPTSAAAAAAQPYLASAARGTFTLGHLPAGSGATLRYELRRP